MHHRRLMVLYSKLCILEVDITLAKPQQRESLFKQEVTNAGVQVDEGHYSACVGSRQHRVGIDVLIFSEWYINQSQPPDNSQFSSSVEAVSSVSTNTIKSTNVNRPDKINYHHVSLLGQTL